MSSIKRFAAHAFLFSSCYVLLSARPAVADETFTATAARGGAPGSPLTVVVTRFATDAERDQVMNAVTTGHTPAVRALLQQRGTVGTVEFLGRRVPVKYAYARTTGGGGRLITVITAEPIGEPGRTGTAGGNDGDVGLVLLQLSTSSGGFGELLTATKVRVNDQGGIVTEGSESQTYQLTSIAKK